MNQALKKLLNNDKKSDEFASLLELMEARDYSILRPTLANLDNQKKEAFMSDAWGLIADAGLSGNFDVRLSHSEKSYSTVKISGADGQQESHKVSYALELVDNDNDVAATIGWLYITKDFVKFFAERD